MKDTIGNALPPGGAISRPVRIRDVQSAKRLLSRVIMQIQRGEVEDGKARLLTYCLSVYVGICKDNDFEIRLKAIEEALGKVKK
jgi:hypothetical protein